MPDNASGSSVELAVKGIQGLIHSMTEFVKLIFVEQRLPALILTIVLVSSSTVVLASDSSDGVKQFLWLTIVFTVLCFTFFVLPRQSKKFQEIRHKVDSLQNENADLSNQCSDRDQELDRMRTQTSDRAKESSLNLEKVEIALENIRSRVKEFLVPGADKSDEDIRKIDIDILQALDYVEREKRKADALVDRVKAAQRMLDKKNKHKASKLFVNYKDEVDA